MRDRRGAAHRIAGRQGSPPDAGELTSYLAGQVGQATLDRIGDLAHPVLDQHVAAVRDAAADVLGPRADDRGELTGFLVRYASGFAAAATAGGWRPDLDAELLDWESMRLAAVCLLAGNGPDRPR